VKWSLRATTKDLDELSVLRPGRMIEEKRDQLRPNLEQPTVARYSDNPRAATTDWAAGPVDQDPDGAEEESGV